MYYFREQGIVAANKCHTPGGLLTFCCIPTFAYFFLKLLYYSYVFTLKCHLCDKIQKFSSLARILEISNHIFSGSGKHLNFEFLAQKVSSPGLCFASIIGDYISCFEYKIS